MIKINKHKTGLILYKKRTEMKLSVSNLSSMLGDVDNSAIYRWETGDHLPNIEHLVDLSKVYKCHVEDLICIEEE